MRLSPAQKLLPVDEDFDSRIDRRVHIRYEPASGIICHLHFPGQNNILSARVLNISAGGMALLVDQAVPPSTRIRVRLANAAQTVYLTVTLTILRSEPRGGGDWVIAGELDRTLIPDELQPFTS